MIADLERSYGASLPENLLHLLDNTEPLNIAFHPRVFQPYSELFDERYLFIGPSIAPRNDAQDVARELHPTSSEQPLILIALGTVFNNQVEFFRQCIRAFGEQPVHVILAYGAYVDRDSLGEIPANFQVYPYVPQLDILPYISAFITHGGMNSTMEALYYGIPMVVIPQMGEQALTAERVSKMQLGLSTTPDQVTVEWLRTAVQEVMHNPTMKEQLAWMQKETQQAGGYKRAADAIMTLYAQQV